MTQEALTTQDVDLYSPLDPSALPDDPVVLKQLLSQLLSMLRKETKRREEVERNMDLLLRKLASSKSLSPAEGQLDLFDTSAEENPAAVNPESIPAPAATSEPVRKCRPHGRRKPPRDLEQVDVVHDLPADLKRELGDNLTPLPDVISYQYDYRAAKLVVLRHVQKKYLRTACDVEISPSPLPASIDTTPASEISSEEAALPIDPAGAIAVTTSASAQNEMPRETKQDVLQGIEQRILLGKKPEGLPSCEAGPGLLAFVWLSKYGDHLPLYRMETIIKRFGVSFTRSTTCDWMMRLADTLHPLWVLMCNEVRRSRVIHTDDTTVPLQDPDTGQRSTARFWDYISDDDPKLTVFEFTRTHERDGPAKFLADFRGYLQADAYNGYDGIYLDSGGRIIEVGCWQHARKRYIEASESDARATLALAHIKSMYEVEKKIRALCQKEWQELTLDERAARTVEIRQRDSVPLLKSLRDWIDKTIGSVLPKSKLGEALRYTMNQWEALEQFTTCGLLDMDNNAAERAHRGIAIGRKNWMYVGSERGGHAAAIHFSLIASCKMNEVEPFAYLVDVLNRLPTTAEADLRQLLPDRWKKLSATET